MIPDLAMAANGEALRKRPHTHHPWLKLVWIPFWTLQLFCQLCFLVLAIMNLMSAIAAILIVLLIISITLNFLIILEIVLFATYRLEPLACLWIQIVKFASWIAVIVLVTTTNSPTESWPSYASSYSKISLAGGFFVVTLAGVEVLLFLGTLLYALVVYIRHRRVLRHLRSSRNEWPILNIAHQPHQDFYPSPQRYEYAPPHEPWNGRNKEVKAMRRPTSSKYSGSVQMGYVTTDGEGTVPEYTSEEGVGVREIEYGRKERGLLGKSGEGKGEAGKVGKEGVGMQELVGEESATEMRTSKSARSLGARGDVESF